MQPEGLEGQPEPGLAIASPELAQRCCAGRGPQVRNGFFDCLASHARNTPVFSRPVGVTSHLLQAPTQEPENLDLVPLRHARPGVAMALVPELIQEVDRFPRRASPGRRSDFFQPVVEPDGREPVKGSGHLSPREGDQRG